MHGLIDILLNGHVLVTIIFIIINLILLFCKKINKKALVILNCLPIIIGIIHFTLYYFKDNIHLTMSFFASIYLTSVCYLVLLLFVRKPKLFKVLTILLVPICIYSFFKTGINNTRYYTIHNYTNYSYTTSFKKMIKSLKKEYVLNDWRKIDYETLEKEYLPLIEQAEKEHNEQLYYDTIFKFIDNFKDGHMGARCLNQACLNTMSKYGLTNYYGFDTVLLDDGRIIAIKVDEDSDAYKKGLRDNYTILKRDDKNIEEYLNAYYYHTNGEPVEYNEKLINSTKIFYRGGDKTKITFLGKNNKEKTIEITSVNKKSNCFYKTLLAYKQRPNYATEMLTDEIGYLNINTEYINRVKDLFSYINKNTSYAKQPIITNLNKLKEQGMKKIIIDLRGNGGGFFHISGAYAEPFTDQEFIYSKAKRHTGYDKYKVKGSGEFKDLPIVVLVNAHTISAADTLLEILGRNPNVTIIGLMPSNNSSQEIGGHIYLTDTSIDVFYPLFNSMTTENTIYIDPDNKREESIKLDIKIPINEETIDKLINRKDYVLDYAIEYLK